jgi:hypothetical protein
MPRQWVGPAKTLFIPLIVEGTAGYDPLPADYEERIRKRVFFDPNPATNEDRSLMSYISSVSYGRASLDATVSEPITLRGMQGNLTLPAINAHPDAHLFEYLAVVFPPNRIDTGGRSAQGMIQFNPPRNPNRTRARARFMHDAHIGTWAMEIIHNVTDLTDFYNGINDPGRFEEMAAVTAMHSTTYSKLVMGWLSGGEVPIHPGGNQRYTLHAVGLPQPPPSGMVVGVRVRGAGANSHRLLFIEARLKVDRWESGISSNSDGIPSEGVVICEFSPENDSWPKENPTGPWPPLELRTPTALTAGAKFVHQDANATIRVLASVTGGFEIEVDTGEVPVPSEVAVPDVRELGVLAADPIIRAAGLKPKYTGQSGPGEWVWKQSPSAGTLVQPGSTVTMERRTGPRP